MYFLVPAALLVVMAPEPGRSLCCQLIRSWKLIESRIYLPDDQSEKLYPAGKDAKGIFLYT